LVANRIEVIIENGKRSARISENKLNSLEYAVISINYALRKCSDPRNIVLGDFDGFEGLDPTLSSLTDSSRKEQTSFPTRGDDNRTAVIITLGQSNAANHGEDLYVATEHVDNLNLYDGLCYQAADPLLGASGCGGNFATRL